MALQFHLDEHIDSALAIALRRRGINVSTTVEAMLCGVSDVQQLEFGKREKRVIVTHDADFLTVVVCDHAHCGIVFVPAGKRTLRQTIDRLVLLSATLEPADMIGHVEFV
jgi:predicted nuclease of predicted toxin-antitoxin system